VIKLNISSWAIPVDISYRDFYFVGSAHGVGTAETGVYTRLHATNDGDLVSYRCDHII
jgi:hypothetical protein